LDSSKRHEINITSCHLAAKIGIATALVRSWENGASHPDDRQMQVLEGLLGCDSDFDPN
jgi:ribosome-binding protein aMBF1 (putative translation factor)